MDKCLPEKDAYEPKQDHHPLPQEEDDPPVNLNQPPIILEPMTAVASVPSPKAQQKIV